MLEVEDIGAKKKKKKKEQMKNCTTLETVGVHTFQLECLGMHSFTFFPLDLAACLFAMPNTYLLLYNAALAAG